MGRTKQLLPWPPDAPPAEQKPLVAAAYDAIAQCCGDIVVVLGHDRQAVRTALGSRPFHEVRSDPDEEMIESIRRGLAEAQRMDPEATVLLQPADHPDVSPPVLRALLAARAESPDHALLPRFGDRGGHPALIPPPVVKRILTWKGAGGVRIFWQKHPELCRWMRVADPSVRRDIDRPDDYPA